MRGAAQRRSQISQQQLGTCERDANWKDTSFGKVNHTKKVSSWRVGLAIPRGKIHCTEPKQTSNDTFHGDCISTTCKSFSQLPVILE